MAETRTPGELRRAIQRAGYYPDLVADTLETSLAGEDVVSYVVHHEPHFDRDELRRHVSVLVLTPSRLLVAHTDEYAADDANPMPYASTSTEAVPLSSVASVVVSRTIPAPAEYRPGQSPQDVVLTVSWGAVGRIELEPASCGDPECEADHGYSGTITGEDFSLRVSEAADGQDVVQQLLAFSRELSAATTRVARSR